MTVVPRLVVVKFEELPNCLQRAGQSGSVVDRRRIHWMRKNARYVERQPRVRTTELFHATWLTAHARVLTDSPETFA